MRRLVEVEPVLLEDAPALGAMIRRELEEFGTIELHLGSLPHGMIGGVTKTILEPGDPGYEELEPGSVEFRQGDEVVGKIVNVDKAKS